MSVVDLLRRAPAEPREPAPVNGPSWTAGPALTARAVSVVLFLAVLSGPLALYRGMTSPTAAPTSLAQSAQAGPLTANTVGEVAQDWVTAWLSTPSERVGELQKRYPQVSEPLTLPKVASQVDRPAVALLSEVEPGTWAVVIGVDVTPPGRATTRSYFQVPVRSSAPETAVVLALPAPVPGPELEQAPRSGYGQPIALTSAAGQTVTAFLAAFAGAQDVTRYVSPGARIRPLKSPAADQVRLRELAASVVVGDTVLQDPPDGRSVRLLATADLLDQTGQPRTSQYALTLTGRAGRWEVAQLDPAPVSGIGLTQLTEPTGTDPAAPPTSQTTTPAAPSGAPTTP